MNDIADRELNSNVIYTANITYKVVVSTPSKPEGKYLDIAETKFKDSSETTQEISTTKRMIIALNFPKAFRN